MPQRRIEDILGEHRLWGLSNKPELIKPLQGGLTNKSYLVHSGVEQFVVRVFAENSEQLDINREAEITIAAIAARHDIGAKPVYLCPKYCYSVSHYAPGEVLRDVAKGVDDKIPLIASTLKELHQIKVGVELPVLCIVEKAEAYWQAIAQLPGSEWCMPYKKKLQDQFSRIPVPEELSLCHHDLVAGNIIVGADKLTLIDWEYAAMGNLYFDLASVVINHQLSHEQEQCLLNNYADNPDADNPDRQRYADAVLQVRYMEWLWWVLQGESKSGLLKRLQHFFTV